MRVVEQAVFIDIVVGDVPPLAIFISAAHLKVTKEGVLLVFVESAGVKPKVMRFLRALCQVKVATLVVVEERRGGEVAYESLL